MNSGNSSMARELKWFYEVRSKTTVERLRKNNIEAEYVSTGIEALARIKDLTPKDATIGIADSESLVQIGIPAWLDGERENGRTLFVPFQWFSSTPQEQASPGQIFETMRKALVADIFLTGCNAVTMDGKLVSIDGEGNRVAAMLFGPRKTIIVMGANKIVNDVDEALNRIRTLCAPLNWKRHALTHGLPFDGMLPCGITGVCNQCSGPAKQCRKTVIIDGQMRLQMAIEGMDATQPQSSSHGIHVILVGETLGL